MRERQETTMEGFLSTLVSTTATLIALLLGAVAAYFVFLQGKAVEYDDKVEIEKRAIRADISELQRTWPGGIDMYLPPEFRERFSARLGNVHGVQFVEKFAGATFAPSPELVGALADVARQDPFGPDHWKGRVFAVAITESVKVISEGAQIEPQSWSIGSPEPSSEAAGAFPRAASGPGFEEWRKDFDRVSVAMRFFEGESQMAESDFREFLQSHPNLRWSPDAIYVNPLRGVFASVNKLRMHLRTIDELSLSRSRYLFNSRVHGKCILVLVLAATLIGIVVPMTVLASSVERFSSIAAISLLLAAVVLLAGSFVQFGRDVFRPLEPDPALYLADRWLRPLIDELDTDKTQFDSLSPVKTERIVQLLDSGPVTKLPSDLVHQLQIYRNAAKAFNSCIEELDTVALSALESSSGLAPFRRRYQEIPNVQHQILHTLDLANADRFAQLRHDLEGSREIVLGVESQFSWGSRGRMALVGTQRTRAALLSALESLQHSFVTRDEVTKCIQTRSETVEQLATLKAHLRQLGQ